MDYYESTLNDWVMFNVFEHITIIVIIFIIINNYHI